MSFDFAFTVESLSQALPANLQDSENRMFYCGVACRGDGKRRRWPLIEVGLNEVWYTLTVFNHGLEETEPHQMSCRNFHEVFSVKIKLQNTSNDKASLVYVCIWLHSGGKRRGMCIKLLAREGREEKKGDGHWKRTWKQTYHSGSRGAAASLLQCWALNTCALALSSGQTHSLLVCQVPSSSFWKPFTGMLSWTPQALFLQLRYSFSYCTFHVCH